MNLLDLKPGQSAVISEIKCNERLKERLNALGIIKGANIVFKMAAPFGDPIIIDVLNTEIALRKEDAQYIYVNN